MKTSPIIFCFIIIGCILLTTGCISQTKNENIPNVTITPSEIMRVQTHDLSSGNATPWIIINPIGAHYIGDVFEINGTTNLGIDEKIPVDVYGGSHSVPYPGVPGTTYGTDGTARIWYGDSGINFWNFSVNSSRFNTNFYFVEVEARNIKNYSRFEMKMYSPTVI